VMRSVDGTNWTGHPPTGANQWSSVAGGGGVFVGVADNGFAMTSVDGMTWTDMPPPEAVQWKSVAFGDGKFVAVSATGTNRVMYASCD
jgi:hypothetical protein